MSGGRHGMEPSSDRASAPCRRGARRRTAAAPKTRAASAPVLVLLLAATCCPFASADLASKDPRKAPRQLLIKLRTGQLLVAPADTAAERAVATGAGPQLDAQLSLRGLSPARVNAADASVESTLEALNARDGEGSGGARDRRRLWRRLSVATLEWGPGRPTVCTPFVQHHAHTD